jgi:cytochrome b subunit of formate dehydrogenase/mono/diheme cytochrome c family protein
MTEHVQGGSYTRFSRTDRIEHLVFITAFTVLVITGMPQKFLPAAWAEFLIRLMGGIEIVRVIHRLAAVVMIVGSVFHILAIAYKIFVRRSGLPMLPGLQDVIDFFVAVRYNLGLSKKRPYYDRFSFEEKLEYWAVIWGTVVMVVTGFMLWNPITTTLLLPGSFVPAAKAAHGGEALLAFLAIIVWHLYNVHIKTFNKSIFNGKLTAEQMEHEHPKEKDRIDAGLVRPLPPAAVIRQRNRVFFPIAGMIVAVFVVVMYFFLSYEQTAIATVPPQEAPVEVFVPASPTPPPADAAEQAAALDRGRGDPIPHEIVGRENCLSCHGLGAIEPFSALHDELKLGNDTCLSCHPPAANAVGLPSVEPAPSFSADILPVLQSRCVVCHGAASDLNLSSYGGVIRGTAAGPILQPRNPDNSRLLRLDELAGAEHPTRFTAEELAAVRAWIEAGAPNN